jgi:hypothetical protein
MAEGLGKDNVRRGVEEARMNGGDGLVEVVEQRVADQGVEPFDVGVVLEDAPEFSEEGLVALACV